MSLLPVFCMIGLCIHLILCFKPFVCPSLSMIFRTSLAFLMAPSWASMPRISVSILSILEFPPWCFAARLVGGDSDGSPDTIVFVIECTVGDGARDTGLEFR